MAAGAALLATGRTPLFLGHCTPLFLGHCPWPADQAVTLSKPSWWLPSVPFLRLGLVEVLGLALFGDRRLVLFDLDRPGRIDSEGFRSKSKNSPFDDHPVQGRVLRTIVDGRTIYQAEP